MDDWTRPARAARDTRGAGDPTAPGPADRVVGRSIRARQQLGLVVGFALLRAIALRGPRGSGRWRPGRRRTPQRHHRLGMVSRAAAGTAITGALLLVSGPASAHADLERSDPAPHAVLHQPPAQVVLRFGEAVTLLPSSVQVVGPDGSRVDTGPTVHASGDPATAAVRLDHPTQHGTYLVSWRVVSDDSHPVSGGYTFSVGAATSTPAASRPSADRGVGIALGAARWLGYAGSALLVGGLLFVVLCRPVGSGRRLLLVGAAAIAVGAVASLLLKGPYDAALGASHLLDGSLLREVLGTTYGLATLARLALALLGGALVLLTRPRLVPVIGFAIAVAVSFSLAGHPIDTHPRWLSVPIDAVHVLAMSAWLGGLVLLAIEVLRHRDEETLLVARRFSNVALTGVIALVATGGYQAWRQVGSLNALADTTYGKELLTKTIIVIVVVTVAASSHALVWRRPDLGRLRRTVAVEAVGVAVVLGVTSALVATQPAEAAYHPSVVATDLRLLGDTVQLSAVPDGDRTMELHLVVVDQHQQPTEPRALTATIADGTVGPIPVGLAKVGTGGREGTVSAPDAGDWTLVVTLRTTALDEDSAQVTLPIR